MLYQSCVSSTEFQASLRAKKSNITYQSLIIWLLLVWQIVKHGLKKATNGSMGSQIATMSLLGNYFHAGTIDLI